jgi:hypothetical protein
MRNENIKRDYYAVEEPILMPWHLLRWGAGIGIALLVPLLEPSTASLI